MICKGCGTEHPRDQEANPHYCIARMSERLEAIEERCEVAERTVSNLYDDVMVMALRLYGEDESTLSPECYAVMKRWKPMVECKLKSGEV